MIPADQLPALQVVVPMLSAPLVVVLRIPLLSWAAAAAASSMAFIIAVALTSAVLHAGSVTYMMGSWPAPYGIELRVTSFSALLLLIVTASSTLALLAGRRSLEADMSTGRQPIFYAVWLLALAGMTGIAVAGDAFNIFVFMEIASLASYVLISAGSDRRALPAVFKYLVMGTIGATFYLIGVGLIYMMTGTLNLEDMEARIQQVGKLKPILVAAGFITVGLALKAAVFPLHAWLPNSYTYAPHIVTAFLAACATKVALYVLLQFDFLVFQQNLTSHAEQFSMFLMPLAVLGILVASASALSEKNIKSLLAYSSIAQVGYILLGASLVSIAGLTAGITHMFNHALAKGALFLAVACLGYRLHSLSIRDIRGIGSQMPWTMAALALAGASLIGIPGTAGFVSKWLLIEAALEKGGLGIVLIIIMVGGSLMALFYIGRILEAAFFGRQTDPQQPVAEAPLWMLTIAMLTALANVYFGLFPSLPVSLSGNAASSLLQHLP